MKKIFLLAGLLIGGHFMHGQVLKKIADRAKNRVENNANNKENNANNKVNNTVDKTVDDVMNPDINKDKNSGDTIKKQETAQGETKNTESSPTSFKAYSKYDFMPGEKVIGFEDFSAGNIGDLPKGWNTTGAGEIVTIESKPGRWLWLTQRG